MKHDLKCWPDQFKRIRAGQKTHEVRRADRPYAVGHVLALREWDPATETYSGEQLLAAVTHLTEPGTFGLPPDLCVMSIAVLLCSSRGVIQMEAEYADAA